MAMAMAMGNVVAFPLCSYLALLFLVTLLGPLSSALSSANAQAISYNNYTVAPRPKRPSQMGAAVAISADGLIMASGAIFGANRRDGEEAGVVKVYKYATTTTSFPQKLGADIHGDADGDMNGVSVALSADGTRLAVGASFNDNASGRNAGQARVFQYTNGTWTQLGEDIDGEAAGDQHGTSVSLSADGTRVAVGAQHNDGNGTDSGHVRVFQYSLGRWTQMGAPSADARSAAAIGGHAA